MKQVLVLCTGNSCRSQMMEGFLRQFSKNSEIFSAGVETHGVNPEAIASMLRAQIDISKHTSNHVDEYVHLEFDLILTVCDGAKEKCPYIPSKAERIHQNFPDPAKASGTPDQVSQEFDRVRDMIASMAKEMVVTHDL